MVLNMAPGPLHPVGMTSRCRGKESDVELVRVLSAGVLVLFLDIQGRCLGSTCKSVNRGEHEKTRSYDVMLLTPIPLHTSKRWQNKVMKTFVQPNWCAGVGGISVVLQMVLPTHTPLSQPAK